jgi:hypothetical protein
MNPSRGGGSTLKYLIPVVALVAVVFGITFFSQYVPPSEDDVAKEKSSAGDPPLRFFASARAWDPPSFLPPSPTQKWDYRGLPLLAPSARPIDPDFPFRFSPQDRAFQGFYEPVASADGMKHTTSFWFENPHARPVVMAVRYVSCGACSGARVAAIPPDVTRQLLQMSRISILPQGLATGIPVGMVGPAANLDESRLTWEEHLFKDDANATYKVPAAGENPDGWSPQWGILQFRFLVGIVGAKPLRIDFHTTVEGSKEVMENKFLIMTEGVHPFDLTRSLIDLGELNDRSEARKFEVIAFSATRGPSRTGPDSLGDLATPVVDVQMPSTQGGDPGKFIQVSPPERIPDAQLGQVSELIANLAQRQRFIRVEAAYRYTVSFDPRADSRAIDIGLLEREIRFALPGTGEPKICRVRGMVSGAVWLDNNLNDITMPNSKIHEGYTKEFKVITARQDIELKLLPEHCTPKHLVLKLEKDPNPASGDRGYYILRVRVPSSKETGQVKAGTWNGEVVMEVKGVNDQRIRIPIKGRIELR